MVKFDYFAFQQKAFFKKAFLDVVSCRFKKMLGTFRQTNCATGQTNSAGAAMILLENLLATVSHATLKSKHFQDGFQGPHPSQQNQLVVSVWVVFESRGMI